MRTWWAMRFEMHLANRCYMFVVMIFPLFVRFLLSLIALLLFFFFILFHFFATYFLAKMVQGITCTVNMTDVNPVNTKWFVCHVLRHRNQIHWAHGWAINCVTCFPFLCGPFVIMTFRFRLRRFNNISPQFYFDCLLGHIYTYPIEIYEDQFRIHETALVGVCFICCFYVFTLCCKDRKEKTKKKLIFSKNDNQRLLLTSFFL